MSHPEDEEFEDMEFDDIDELWDDDLEDPLDETEIEIKSEEPLTEISVDEGINLEPEAEASENDETPVQKPEKPKKEKKIKVPKEVDPNAPKKKIGVVGPLLLLSILGGAGFVVYSTILNPPKPQIIPAITAQTPQPAVIDKNDVIQDNATLDQAGIIIEETQDLSFDQAPLETAPITDDQVLTPFPEITDTSDSDDLLPSLSFEEETSEESTELAIDPFEDNKDIAAPNALDEDNMLLKTDGVIEDMPAFPEDTSEEDASTTIAHELDFNIEPVNINDLDVEKAIRVEPEIEITAPELPSDAENNKTLEDLSPVEDLSEQIKDEGPAPAQISELPEETTAPIEEPKAEVPAVQPIKKPEIAKKVEATKVTPAPAPKINWVIRAAQPGKAVISDKNGTLMQSIEVGDKVNGIGTVKSISKTSGKWLIQGTAGKITQ